MLRVMDVGDHSTAERRLGGERRRRRRYRFHDRRSGFDRRVSDTHTGRVARLLVSLRDDPRRLRRLLAWINLLNAADFLLTLVALESGGREANPLLRPLFMVGPIWAAVFKLVIVLAATLIIWESRRYRIALLAGLCMLVVFAVLMPYHLIMLCLLWSG